MDALAGFWCMLQRNSYSLGLCTATLQMSAGLDCYLPYFATAEHKPGKANYQFPFFLDV